jgi:hypothetical protein
MHTINKYVFSSGSPDDQRHNYLYLGLAVLALIAILTLLKKQFSDFSHGNDPEARTTPVYVANRTSDQAVYQQVT